MKCVAAILVLAAAMPAHAQRATPAAAPTLSAPAPTSVVVSDVYKVRVRALLDAGNRRYQEALERYRAALVDWAHPAIRCNMVRALFHLRRPTSLLFAAAPPVHAQRAIPAPAPTRSAPAPWSVGVSDVQKARAQALLDAGNALFLEQAYQEALERYRAALLDWDHPAIRFNMVRVLIHLGRSVEAYENLLRAMAYGAAPLTASVYAEALSYRKLLEGQIATVTVSCVDPVARVTVDGQSLVTCPGQASRRVLPGTHQVVAARPGFLASTRDVLALPGRTVRVSIAPVRIEDAEIVTRRWAPWKPWAVTAAGAFLGAVGWYYQRQAREHMREFDEVIDRRCHAVSCGSEELEPVVLDLEPQARRERWYAIGAFSVGGAAIVAGVVGVVLNLPHRELPSDFHAGAFTITPGPGGGSLHLAIPF